MTVAPKATRLTMRRGTALAVAPLAALVWVGIGPPLTAVADSNVYGRVWPNNCNLQNAPKGGCVIAVRRGASRIEIVMIGPYEKVATVRSNGALLGEYRLGQWSDLTIPRSTGSYTVKVKFLWPKGRTTYASTWFRLT